MTSEYEIFDPLKTGVCVSGANAGLNQIKMDQKWNMWLMMEYEISFFFYIWSTLGVAQTYLVPLSPKVPKWIKKCCPWGYLNSKKCAPSYSYLVFLVMGLHFGFLFNQKNGKRIQPICLLFLLPQCRILIQLSKNTLRNLKFRFWKSKFYEEVRYWFI